MRVISRQSAIAAAMPITPRLAVKGNQRVVIQVISRPASSFRSAVVITGPEQVEEQRALLFHLKDIELLAKFV
jgi:hypothetical protein